MSYTRGDVVVATDPFKDNATTGRPFLIILSQRGNPALPVRDECSDLSSEPRTEQGGEEARALGTSVHAYLPA